MGTRRTTAKSAGGRKSGTCAAEIKPRVRWRQLPDSHLDRELVARDLLELLSGHIQRPVNAPTVYRSAEADSVPTSQSKEPISYAEAAERMAGVVWDDAPEGPIKLLTADGQLIERETPARAARRSKFEEMAKPRRPMRINQRPGIGGFKRLPPGELDVLEGLEAFGSPIWQAVPGGARIGLVQLNPEGNTVLACRLSSEDRHERLVNQIEPALALAKRYSETLIPRFILLAENMSGMREVRPERAGPPTDGGLERDDMLLLDRWLAEGWLTHIVWRDGDRIARDLLPGETLLKRWEKNKVGLWLASYGRQMDYVADRLALRAMMMVSAEERLNSTRRMGMARMNKGPLAGNGWGPLPFGFYRDEASKRPRQDLEQTAWVHKAFEYAAAGATLDGNGLSTRKLAQRLLDEGCPFDHDRLRRILQSPIYATGEWTQKVRGIAVAQRPIELESPIPLDLFLKVQNLLALRQAATDRTPLGEFLFNYTEVVHKQCQGERRERRKVQGQVRPENSEGYIDRPLIRGYWAKDIQTPRYRHIPFVPEQCKSGGRGWAGAHTWKQEDLERPVVEAIRGLASHPELLRQAALLARHEFASASGPLSDAQRAKLKRQIAQILEEQDAYEEAEIDKAGQGGGIDWERLKRFHGKVDRRIAALELQLKADDALRARETANDQREDHVTTFLEIMTVETPDDPFLKAMRARLFQRIIDKVEIDDDGRGSITITIYGHLVPENATVEAANPFLASADLLDGYRAVKEGRTPEPDGKWEELQLKTDLSVGIDKSVWSLYPELERIPSGKAQDRLRQLCLASTSWAHAAGPAKTGYPAWLERVEVRR